MSRKDAHRELYAELSTRGLLDYGAVIPSSVVRGTLGLEFPNIGTKSEFDRLSLLELAAIDYVRNVLLGQGRYIAGTTTGYRVLLPSENAGQIEQYMSAADKKLSRALKLSRNSPVRPGETPDQTEARILMKREGARSFRPQPTNDRRKLDGNS